MDIKTLLDKTIDYILFSSEVNYKNYLHTFNLKDTKQTRGLFISAYKKAVYICNH